MRKFITFLIILFSFNVLAAKTLKVAVIDTGLDENYIKYTPLCETGHKDFTGEGLNDINGHGTNVTGLIVTNSQTTNYCIVIIKAYAYRNGHRSYIPEALEYAYNIHANIINLSGGGPDQIERERNIVLKILNSKVVLIVAAGNDGIDLDQNCYYYPACYDSRIYVVGNNSISSNYGKYVDIVYDGNNKSAFGQTMSGSSQSTALFTADLLKNIALLQKKK